MIVRKPAQPVHFDGAFSLMFVMMLKYTYSIQNNPTSCYEINLLLSLNVIK